MTAALPANVAALIPFVDARIFDLSEVHLAATVDRLAGGVTPEVALAVACAARAPRLGHVCVELDAVASAAEADLETVGFEAVDLPWPDPQAWAAALVAATDVVADPAGAHVEPLRPLVWDGRRLYLQRYWNHEERAAVRLLERAGDDGSIADDGERSAALDALFGTEDPGDVDLQRRAAESALTGRLSVVAGGPGTGKTRTIARLVAAAHRLADPEAPDLLVGLAAPTGKAAARMSESVRHEVDLAEADGAIDGRAAALARATEATTLHRLLGSTGGLRFRHDRSNPLPHDLVVVDEVSMVSLPLLARLLDAVRPDARLVLVGDPDQLVSVEAGTVMGDIVAAAPSARVASSVTVLRRTRRFAEDSAIAQLAAAVRAGDVDAVGAALMSPSDTLQWVRDDDAEGLGTVTSALVDAGVEVVAAARAGDAVAGMDAATRIKVLAATRRHPLGRNDWSERIEAGVASRVADLGRNRTWYVGRPVIIGANDPLNGVANGDVGLVVASEDGPAVALPGPAGTRLLAPSRLDHVAAWWAMTVHKSQGSEFPHAVVSLPSVDSPVLTRELLYTAVTRARERVTIVASEASLRAAVGRPIRRASGLRDRLVAG